jgi:hypothetical protein
MKNLFLSYWGCSLILFGAGTAYAIEPATALDPTKFEFANPNLHQLWKGPYIEDDNTFTTTTTDYANPSLQTCLNARVFTPAAPIKTNDFDCVPTDVDDKGELLNAADKDYTQWNDVLYYGKSNTPITGFYTKKGKRCDGLTAATKECPVAAKAKFVVTCNTSDTTSYQNGKCIVAKDIKTYRAVYQAFAIPGEKAVKTTIVGDSGISGNSTAALPVSTTAINANLIGELKCPGTDSSGNPLFQKGNVYGYPICEPDTTVNIMRDQICKQMMQNIWEKGGTSTSPCEIITVTKVFPLSNYAGKTTNDCQNITPAESRKLYKVYNGVRTEIPDFNLQSIYGGKLSGTINNEAEFKQKYEIVTSSPSFVCQIRKEVEEKPNYSWSSATSDQFTLPSNYVPGSLYVTVSGAGGGGGGSNQRLDSDDSGGEGGKAGNVLQNNHVYLATVPGAVCKVTVGGGGGGGSPGAKTQGGPGGDTSISCGNGGWNTGQAWVTGGAGSGLRANKWDSGTDGENSKLVDAVGNSIGGGGKAGTPDVCKDPDSQGKKATQPGAGGGGGDTKDCAQQWSGGGGADGYAKVESWKVYEWVDWTP